MTAPAVNKGQRHQFLPARFTSGGIAQVPWNGSGDLIAAASADGLIDLPVGAAYNTGHVARFMPFVGWQAGNAGNLPARPTKK